MRRRVELPYGLHSERLFSQLQAEPWSVFLDSGCPYGPGGRYDILAAAPFMTLTTVSGQTCICSSSGTTMTREDPFLILRQQLGADEDEPCALPFCGGALGYFSYELGHSNAGLSAASISEPAMPDMAIGIYDWALIVDHVMRRSYLLGAGRDPETEKNWSKLVQRFSDVGDGPGDGEAKQLPDRVAGHFQVDTSRSAYFAAFQRIQDYIRDGDCYQVNLTQRFHLDGPVASWPLYCSLRRRNPAPFSAFMRLPGAAILSFSPESFLQVRGHCVTTRPIKGTRERSRCLHEDQQLIQALQNSEKDRAENLMIVDLLRNDLSRSCIPGSVKVPQLCRIESYASVHHLVSTVTGCLQPGQHALDVLRHCFPGGSITGAPKRRAMQIIDDLEPWGRGVYCGSLVHIGFNGDMGSSIAIRTLVHHDSRLYCWSGGGIVSDSKAETEYQECFDKLSAILRFFRPAGVHPGRFAKE